MLFKRIKDWATSIVNFRTGDVIPVDGPNGTAKMSKDDLLQETAQNALAGNVAPAFDPTRTSENPYHENEFVVYNGQSYRCTSEHYGAWNASHFAARSADKAFIHNAWEMPRVYDVAPLDRIVVGNPDDGNRGINFFTAKQIIQAGNLAPAFDATRTSEDAYQPNDHVVYNGQLYRCTSEHYGAWNASHFEVKDVISFINDNTQKLEYGHPAVIELAEDIGESCEYGTTLDTTILTQTTIKTTVYFEKSLADAPKPSYVFRAKVLSVQKNPFSLWKVSVDEVNQEATCTKIGDYYGNGGVITIPLFVALQPNEYIGITGNFAFRSFYGDSAQFMFVDDDGSLSTAVTGVLGLMYEGLYSGFLNQRLTNDESFSSVLAKLHDFISNGGGNISETTSYKENTNVFWGTRSDVPKVKYVTGVKIYKTIDYVTLWKVKVTGSTATKTKIMDVINKDFIPLFVELAADEFIGVSGYFKYGNSAGSPYSYSYVDTNGDVHSYDGGALGLEIQGFADPKASADPYRVIVAADGSGNYSTIHDALIGTYGTDTAEHPVTIFVKAGIYNEPGKNGSWGVYPVARHVAIIGENKVNTIIRNTNGYYYPGVFDNSCIKVSGNVYIANLTLESTDSDYEEPTGTEYTDKHRAYCIHVDSDVSGSGNVVEINNCTMRNDHNCCVGIGTRENLVVKIVGCDMESTLYEPNDFSVVYAHDGHSGSTEEVTQFFEVRESTLKCTNGGVALKVANPFGHSIGCTFVGNACSFTSGGSGASFGAQVVKDELCSGNNVSVMNYNT